MHSTPTAVPLDSRPSPAISDSDRGPSGLEAPRGPLDGHRGAQVTPDEPSRRLPAKGSPGRSRRPRQVAALTQEVVDRLQGFPRPVRQAEVPGRDLGLAGIDPEQEAVEA